jgi:hypothetical protein
MKTTVLCLFLAVFMLMSTQCIGTSNFSVQIRNEEISKNLDLEAVASVFGKSNNLEDFERKLNDPETRISNLDLNRDGAVDYLRVIESNENNIHLIVIQAVLDVNTFQDVATIVVEKTTFENARVQVIGNPHLYGPNYVIDPVFNYPPAILSFFWGTGYVRWSSPYYWGYYPRYYHSRPPFSINIYRTNIYEHVNRDYRFNYSNRINYENYERMHNSVRRNDYGDRHPETRYQDRRQYPQINQRSGSRTPQIAPSINRNESERRSPNVSPNRENNRRPVESQPNRTPDTRREESRPSEERSGNEGSGRR